MSAELITFDNLSIGYDNQPVLSGISLSIARASFTAILGANGSGKSTLLKTLLGLQPPVAGRIQHRLRPPTPRWSSAMFRKPSSSIRCIR